MKSVSTNQDQTVVVSSSDSYYDDCPVCRAMKEAEKKGKNLNMVEIAEAFGKAKKQGGVVGGPILKNDTIN